MWEHCAERESGETQISEIEFVGKMCLGRDWGNTVLREILRGTIC